MFNPPEEVVIGWIALENARRARKPGIVHKHVHRISDESRLGLGLPHKRQGCRGLLLLLGFEILQVLQYVLAYLVQVIVVLSYLPYLF